MKLGAVLFIISLVFMPFVTASESQCASINKQITFDQKIIDRNYNRMEVLGCAQYGYVKESEVFETNIQDLQNQIIQLNQEKQQLSGALQQSENSLTQERNKPVKVMTQVQVQQFPQIPVYIIIIATIGLTIVALYMTKIYVNSMSFGSRIKD